MRRLFLIAIVLSTLVFTSSAVAAPLFVISGRGWGHGIGMSQYGAYGFAQHGWTYRQILARYYSGTTVDGGHGRKVGVLLASGRSSLSIGSDSSFTVTSNGRTYRLRAGAHTIRPSLVVTDANGNRRTLRSPATFRPGTSRIELSGLRYRGVLVVRSNGSSLAVANRLSLDGYVKGVVPREMPASWAMEALKAQAVAARSYALATGGHCSFGGTAVFCATTSDQVYGGMAAETLATNAAVTATAGQAVEYAGRVATTFFYSTSGGRTAAKHDEWGGDRIPYLVSVADPYDSISPHHGWGARDGEVDCPGTSRDCVFTRKRLKYRLGSALPDALRDMIVSSRNSSRRVASVTATGTTTKQISGATMRAKLGLRSTWFSIGVISLAPSRSKVVYGTSVRLSGLARGVRSPTLQRKRYEGSWTSLSLIDPAADGTWSRTLTPVISTSYRVATGNIAGIARLVYVVARVNFYPPESTSELRGVVGPKKAGSSVTVQKRQDDGTWNTVATATTDSAGEFTAHLTVSSGTYRAIARVGPGYLAGTTPLLEIS